ncbi:NAD(P)/FAD-dependent oxidoreductase [Glycomyces harbinensis]|uniref:3-phenylpropionate/trans-cinnamate dioxygenase ferredoxin reductase subunit n=1 Tax=Glycomyces harbinensis TaxID=58114 RepID=A0A1G7CPV3_9ACTN|nr:FAD/NAD(P)-binding oxidoreductase [Glycomyces harbinensis]SDE40525.1 3-phenylpropionate/trans-cinnamate dioxygenase ferredoxin reductase subunit [Glycomyces harbinensis]
MSSAPHVIVGGGLAASKAAQTFREEGYEGDLVIVTGEAHRPYERPPLSKDYLRGEADRSALFTVDEDWYDRHADVRTGSPATGLDPGARRLALADGTALEYAKLLLATGSSPLVLPFPGADLRGVHLLRTVEQSEHLAAALKEAERVAIVGDGWIGMEVAASARQMGREVTVFGLGAQPLERVLGPEMGLVFGKLHTDHGVDLRRRTQVAKILGEEGRAVGVETKDGERVDADLVLLAVGATPNTGLAVAAGLELRGREFGGGVAVDGRLRTSGADIWAAGDIASVPSPRFGRPVRVEHWQTAIDSGRHAARAMLGDDTAYDKLPYFFTDQYDLGMEYTGFVAGPDAYDEVVVSGSVESLEFVAFWAKDGRVLAGMGVNTWDRMGEVEAIIRAEKAPTTEALQSFR